MNSRAPRPYRSVHHLRRSVRWFIEDSNPTTQDLLVPTEVYITFDGVSINPSRVEPEPSHLKTLTWWSVCYIGQSVHQDNNKGEVV